jgi:hypothetical protein
MKGAKKYKVLSYLISFLIVINLVPLIKETQAAGASLYLTPMTGTYVVGGKFNVSVKANTGGETVNAAEGTISFDKSLLEVSGISKGGSIFSLWTAEPSFSNSAGTISFGGGIPRPGYKGSAGQICSISFKAKKAGSAQVRFASGAVLAADGLGTNVLASMGSGNYTISPKVEAPVTTPEEKKPSEKPATKPIEKIEPTVKSPAEQEEYNLPKITSDTHPDQNTWYSRNTAKFKWDLPTEIKEVSITLDENPSNDPGDENDGLFSEKEYTNIKDGVWYVHLKFKDGKKWGDIAHYRILVDTTPPEPFEIRVRRIDVGDWPVLEFDAKDNWSGLNKYDLYIGSLEMQAHEIKAEEKSYKLSDLSIGEHTALLKAIDKAGNERPVTVKFNIEPIPAPVIVKYPEEVKPSDQFYINGTALANVHIDVFLLKENNNVISTSSIKSDISGNWYYINNDKLENGRYFAWVEAVNDKGIKSKQSAKVSFLVSPPIFTKIGSFVINYFTVFVSLLFMILLIIILILYIIGLIKRKLRKETVEIEDVLHKNMAILKSTVDKELKGIDEADNPKIKLKKNIDTIEKQILKEIKDVEEILK